ncbi:hypothetical protein EIP91_010461 [Steccherinum ochraceum]|uniref:Uncharacterized protein n=1 Tax=Steccherinum ochraceum TaxID=92696 RepID=A0A4R0RLT4_9APHY|nr:hypothetical protein EIP91_010461 [Steccherinum ochraceum]
MDPLPYNVTISSQTASIVYAPNRDGDPTAGWNVTYSSGTSNTSVDHGVAQGVGTDSHWTVHDGASLQLSWVGTAAYLYGDATSASYSMDIDGQSVPSVGQGGLLGSKTGLSYGNHTVTLITQGTDPVVFQYAEVTVGIGYSSGSPVQNRTIFAVQDDNTTPNPFFSYVSSPDANTWHVEDAKFILQPNGTTTPLPRQMFTGDPTASVSFTLSNTTAFFLYGAVNSDHHPKSVSIVPASNLNLIRRAIINDTSSALDFKQILYWESGLDRDEAYTVQIAQIGPEETSMSFSSLDIIDGGSGPMPSGSPTSSAITSTGAQTGVPSDPSVAAMSDSTKLTPGVIAGISIASVTILIVSVVALLFWRHKRHQRRESEHLLEATTLLPIDPGPPFLQHTSSSLQVNRSTQSASFNASLGFDGGLAGSTIGPPPVYESSGADRRVVLTTSPAPVARFLGRKRRL